MSPSLSGARPFSVTVGQHTGYGPRPMSVPDFTQYGHTAGARPLSMRPNDSSRSFIAQGSTAPEMPHPSVHKVCDMWEFDLHIIIGILTSVRGLRTVRCRYPDQCQRFADCTLQIP